MIANLTFQVQQTGRDPRQSLAMCPFGRSEHREQPYLSASGWDVAAIETVEHSCSLEKQF